MVSGRAAPAGAQIPTRGPYLVDASSVSARVCWRVGRGPSGYACRGFLRLEFFDDRGELRDYSRIEK
ncbi:MAG: hypothetical protein ABII00_18165 [Elusimicrobiota bacterium]